MPCSFQIFIGDQWVHCATLVAREGKQGGSIFEYDLDYAFSGTLEPVSLRFPVDASHHTLAHLPPFFTT
jgi:HipA-like protein